MLQTQFSVKATSLAESFAATVGRMRVGPYGYTPNMTAPEGPSTGGGVQALQHIRLLPPQPNMPTLVVGHANQKDAAAELRTLEHVDAICRDRFRQGAPLDPAAYAQFLQSAQGFLTACGMRVSFAGPPADLLARAAGVTTPSTAPAKGSSTTTAFVVGVIALLAMLGAAMAWFFFKK